MSDVPRQLRLLGELQVQLLPKDLPAPAGWNLAVHYAVGQHPGGDYYDFLSLPDGREAFIIADASDQGIPAVVMGAIVHVALHSCPLSSGTDQQPFCPIHDIAIRPPHIILRHLNRVLKENSLEEHYMTAILGVLNPSDGTMNFANAGHPTPRWWRAARKQVEPFHASVGLPLGLRQDANYHVNRIHVDPGDLVVLHTDGVTSSVSPNGELFGLARLDRAIAQFAAGGAEGVRDGILEVLDEYLDGATPQDDVTLLVLERWT
jgi:sigma-B regulation protein RsbU (phosphoserine phosphatase)